MERVKPIRKGMILWFLIPFLPYVVPVLLGLAWLPVGDLSEHLNGSQYPYGYSGRKPALAPTPDPKTSSQYNIPYFVQLGNFLKLKSLPLWNPNAGLGMPMAAMGEGSPYSPLSLLRAVSPPRFHDLLSIAGFLAASLFFLLFLTEIGVEAEFALLATAVYSLQGAFTSTILLPNIAQSLSMLPVVFWSCARAINRPAYKGQLVLILSLVLFIISGHIQHVFIGIFALSIFAAAYSLYSRRPLRARLPALSRVAASMAAALLLTAPFLFPVYSYIKAGYHHHPTGIGLKSVTMMTINYIFDPLQFGGFRSAIRSGGVYLFQTNENLLYFGLAFFFLSAVAVVNIRKWARENAGVLICLVTGLFIFFKFTGVFMARWLGYLPLFENMGLKHHGGIISFLLIPTAAVGARLAVRRGRAAGPVLLAFSALIIVMAAVLYYYGLQRGIIILLWGSLKYRLVIIVAAFYFVLTGPDEKKKIGALIILIVSELSIYLPMGLPLGHPTPLMVAVFGAGALTAVFYARYGQVLSCAAGLVTIALFAALVAMPDKGLPERQALTTPPPHLEWINNHKSASYRVFGIPPSYSAIPDIQDFGTTQPIVPKEFAFFTEVVGGAPTRFYGPLWFHLYAFRSGKHTGYALKDYLKYKSTWDLFGLKYLIVNKNTCIRDRAGCAGVESDRALRKVFEDSAAMVFESKGAVPRVFAAATWRNASSPEEARKYVKAHAEGLGRTPPVIEGSEAIPGESPERGYPFPITAPPVVELAEYAPNSLVIKSNFSRPHMVVVTDNYGAGWRAFVDGEEARLLRADAMVRAVFVPGGGEHIIRMVYAPTAFYTPLKVSSATLIGILLYSLYEGRKRKKPAP